MVGRWGYSIKIPHMATRLLSGTLRTITSLSVIAVSTQTIWLAPIQEFYPIIPKLTPCPFHIIWVMMWRAVWKNWLLRWVTKIPLMHLITQSQPSDSRLWRVDRPQVRWSLWKLQMLIWLQLHWRLIASTKPLRALLLTTSLLLPPCNWRLPIRWVIYWMRQLLRLPTIMRLMISE